MRTTLKFSKAEAETNCKEYEKVVEAFRVYVQDVLTPIIKANDGKIANGVLLNKINGVKKADYEREMRPNVAGEMQEYWLSSHHDFSVRFDRTYDGKVAFYTKGEELQIPVLFNTEGGTPLYWIKKENTPLLSCRLICSSDRKLNAYRTLNEIAKMESSAVRNLLIRQNAVMEYDRYLAMVKRLEAAITHYNEERNEYLMECAF